MGKVTGIDWCDSTFNIAQGCVKVSAGCDRCYAEKLSHRYGFDVWGPGVERRTFGAAHWAEPVKWNRIAEAEGRRHRVFCSSMTDIFLNDRTIDAERAKLWPLIEATPALDWLLLTKHPERWNATLPVDVPENVWMGVSIENEDALWRARYLAEYAQRFAVTFVSGEPLLGDLSGIAAYLPCIDWMIVGGESGPNARPMDLAWARDLRDLCEENRTAFFLKQLGGHPDARAHNKAVLDGRLHKAFPVLERFAKR